MEFNHITLLPTPNLQLQCYLTAMIFKHYSNFNQFERLHDVHKNVIPLQGTIKAKRSAATSPLAIQPKNCHPATTPKAIQPDALLEPLLSRLFMQKTIWPLSSKLSKQMIF
jgi:hypothetical protein